MTGQYEIILYNNKVQYRLAIQRNISILRGNSATGKTELIRLLTQYNSNRASSGITLLCERECTVLTEENWRLFPKSTKNRIFFVDEGNGFLRTKEFAEMVKGADHYFVIISRENLPQLPYSVEEIYGLREGKDAGRYIVPKRVYNEMYRIYGGFQEELTIPEIVVTEDSNAGNEFFRLLFPGKCISAGAKSNIKRVLVQHRHQHILAVVDGAAFGPEMPECMEMIGSVNGTAALFAPESFEYLILKSGLIEVPKSILEETWNYADSAQFFSWEEFYTRYLTEKTQGEVYRYSKKKLHDFFKTVGSIDKIRRVLPDSLQHL